MRSSLKQFAFSLLPTSIRVQGRSYLHNLALDWRDQITGQADRGIPPRHLNISGGGPFREYGQNIVMLCRRYADLRPNDKVLDIGCGIGRTAVALTSFLETGTYSGFDIIRFAVDWCRDNITAKYPNFRFIHADIYNLTYNPRGRAAADTFQFPFDNRAFSFAIATSLFTHVLPASAENYIAQASRVLAPGAHFLSTWFLLDTHAEDALHAGTARLQFPHRFSMHAQSSLHAPEQAVAYDWEQVKDMFRRQGFELVGTYRGDWSGPRPENDTIPPIESMQDVIIARRGK